jgi:RNA polymerase sigma-70 factor (ECF subfamily)
LATDRYIGFRGFLVIPFGPLGGLLCNTGHIFCDVLQDEGRIEVHCSAYGYAGGLVDEQLDDAAIVGAARRGDPDAWERLYRRIYPRLAAYLARRVGAAHRDDAVSETMARAVAGLDRMTVGPAGFDGWVFGIARRVAADHHRRGHRYQRQDAAASLTAGRGDVPDDSPEVLLVAEDHAELRRAFARLNPAEQEVLELRVIAGLTAEQVADVLGKRAGTVRTAQSRALAHLRELVDREQVVMEADRD